eukprot:g48152.t1
MDGFFIAPAIILLLLGLGMFTVSFAGMIGALRDNELLLQVVSCLFEIEMFFEDMSLAGKGKKVPTFAGCVQQARQKAHNFCISAVDSQVVPAGHGEMAELSQDVFRRVEKLYCDLEEAE